MNAPAPTLTDHIDQRAQKIIRARLAGRVSDDTARWEIAALVSESKVAADVARAAHTMREREAMELALTELLERKVVDPNANGFQFTLAANASLCGWARKMARAALASKQRDFREAERRFVLVEPTPNRGNDDSALTGAERTYHHAPANNDYDGRIEEALSRFEADSHWSRGTRIIHARARALADGFGVPFAQRPLSFETRKALESILESDPDMAIESAAAYANKRFGATMFQRVPTKSIHPDLLKVWGSYSLVDIEEIVTKEPQVALTLALSAVADLQRPDRRAQVELKRILGHNGSGRGWKSLSVALTESFIALECETTSAWSSPTPERLDEMKASRAIARRAFIDRAEKTAAWPGSPLGETAGEVHAFCLSALNDLTEASEFTPGIQATLGAAARTADNVTPIRPRGAIA